MTTMIATKTIKPPYTQEGKLPSVCYIERAKQWSCKIGYNMTASGRQRAFQYVKENHNKVGQHNAGSRALELRDQWERVETEWDTVHRPRMEKIAPEMDWSKPVWPTSKFILELVQKFNEKSGTALKEVESEMLGDDKADLARVAERNPKLIVKAVDPFGQLRKTSSLTIEQARDNWVADMQGKVGLAGGHGLKSNTFNNYRDAVKIALSPLDITKSIDTLSKSNLEGLVKHWMKLPIAKNKHGEEKQIKVRTAVGYCKRVRMFLLWLADQEGVDFQMPKGCDRLFRFSGFNKSAVPDYQTALPKIKRLLANATDRTRLYMLLAMNIGGYQVDIGAIKHEELVQRNGEWYIWRQREKTSAEDSGYQVLHWLMPETVALLMRYAAPATNPHGRLLLNDEGQPLWQAAEDKARKDAITLAFKRVITKFRNADKKAGSEEKFQFVFKQFRKIGATAIKRIAGADVSRMYLGQVVPGVLRMYAQDDFAVVTESLKTWHKELIAAEIFPS